MKLGKILVPLDGSALAETALPKAIELAQDSGAKVELLRAAEAPVEPPAAKGAARPWPEIRHV